jgi:hypothetical protein
MDIQNADTYADAIQSKEYWVKYHGLDVDFYLAIVLCQFFCLVVYQFYRIYRQTCAKKVN